eukprot:CAMPEP_0184006264 /NCGR_PEP_ID=MMETSP0954-20121128/572_1 /TAXON_ID=627963 /ORGANISM="Aplanochytrium sp, Strain PBS07" /LENGTH=531 /DNA_ID=CAMNT_0026284745 /DNA_START=60 /DNA_END=1655 /DNA_ORIENTATION=-
MATNDGNSYDASNGVPGFAPETINASIMDMPLAGGSSMLSKLGLSRNPYTDRTAEKTTLKSGAFYLHSDLQGFEPSETTYIFFGRRGSGKTTIRLMMMKRYMQYNEEQAQAGKKSFFIVDLCRPGHMEDCLKAYMHAHGANLENWDAVFQEKWKSTDLADCIVSFAINELMRRVAHGTKEGADIINSLGSDKRSAAQFLLLAHLYTREDSATLAALRRKLLPTGFTFGRMFRSVIGFAALGAACAGLAFAWQSYYVDSSIFDNQLVSAASSHPKLAVGSFALGCTGLIGFMNRRARTRNKLRAEQLCAPVRIADARVDLVDKLLVHLASPDDSADVLRRLHIGSSAQQKLELLDNLCKSCGYSGLAVFGDCFDEVGLLDPLLYPTALKVFAREVCRNEILNQGRFHFFFPDSRASLDLSTDRVVREARFDRHFVRDLTWSRFQLQDLAERRFLAAQPNAGSKGGQPKFGSLFEHVSREDFSGAISKLQTPRELMVFMTELLARVEAHAEDNTMVAAQDMEIAVSKAKSQSV